MFNFFTKEGWCFLSKKPLSDKRIRELYQIVDVYAYGGYVDDEEKKTRAKDSLIEFLQQLKLFRPSIRYRVGRFSHLHYISFLWLVREYIKEGQYPYACNELVTLLAFYDIRDPRIYHNVLDLLKNELEDGYV